MTRSHRFWIVVVRRVVITNFKIRPSNQSNQLLFGSYFLCIDLPALVGMYRVGHHYFVSENNNIVFLEKL